MPTDAQANERIALAISPHSTGWAWKDCPACDGAGTWEAQVDLGRSPNEVRTCRPCHGTGRVPVALEKNDCFAPLVEWAMEFSWFKSVRPKLLWLLGTWLRGGLPGPRSLGPRARDLIFTALADTDAPAASPGKGGDA